MPRRVSTKTWGLMEPIVEVSKASHLKWVIRFGHERVEAEKFSWRKQANNRLPFVTVKGDPDNSGDEQVNVPRPARPAQKQFHLF